MFKETHKQEVLGCNFQSKASPLVMCSHFRISIQSFEFLQSPELGQMSSIAT